MSRHTLAGIALLSLLLLGFTNSEEFTAGPQTAAKFESAFTGIETFLDAIDDCTAGQAVGGAGADTVPSACLTLAGLDRQAADCSAETGGTSGELCLQTADDTLWACPASAAPCDGAGWLQIAGGAGGSTFQVDGTLVADPDLRSDGDQQAVLCVGAGNPDPACVAAGDVLLRHQPASVALADMADAPAGGILSGPSGSGGTPVYQVPSGDNQIPVSFLGGSAWLWSKVSNDALDVMSQSRIKGRPAGAGIGSPQDLTPVQVADVLGSEVLKPDGSVAMTGALDVGGQRILASILDQAVGWHSSTSNPKPSTAPFPNPNLRESFFQTLYHSDAPQIAPANYGPWIGSHLSIDGGEYDGNSKTKPFFGQLSAINHTIGESRLLDLRCVSPGAGDTMCTKTDLFAPGHTLASSDEGPSLSRQTVTNRMPGGKTTASESSTGADHFYGGADNTITSRFAWDDLEGIGTGMVVLFPSQSEAVDSDIVRLNVAGNREWEVETSLLGTSAETVVGRCLAYGFDELNDDTLDPDSFGSLGAYYIASAATANGGGANGWAECTNCTAHTEFDTQWINNGGVETSPLRYPLPPNIVGDDCNRFHLDGRSGSVSCDSTSGTWAANGGPIDAKIVPCEIVETVNYDPATDCTSGSCLVELTLMSDRDGDRQTAESPVGSCDPASDNCDIEIVPYGSHRMTATTTFLQSSRGYQREYASEVVTVGSSEEAIPSNGVWLAGLGDEPDDLGSTNAHSNGVGSFLRVFGCGDTQNCLHHRLRQGHANKATTLRIEWDTSDIDTNPKCHPVAEIANGPDLTDVDWNNAANLMACPTDTDGDGFTDHVDWGVGLDADGDGVLDAGSPGVFRPGAPQSLRFSADGFIANGFCLAGDGGSNAQSILSCASRSNYEQSLHMVTGPVRVKSVQCVAGNIGGVDPGDGWHVEVDIYDGEEPNGGVATIVTGPSWTAADGSGSVIRSSTELVTGTIDTAQLFQLRLVVDQDQNDDLGGEIMCSVDIEADLG